MTDLDAWRYPLGPGAWPGIEASTYHKAFGFLADCASVEDWGCAMAYGRKFFPAGTYRGVDGSKWAAPYADVIADLRTYQPDPRPEGIVMRHVLEHNLAWQDILVNAVKAFTRKFCLITFTPFAERTGQVSRDAPNGLVLSFRREDLTGCFDGLTMTEEQLATETQYGSEHIFYLEKP